MAHLRTRNIGDVLPDLIRMEPLTVEQERVLVAGRESGALEQHADVVLGLYRPGAYDANADREIAEIGILKHRNGPIGVVAARFRLSTGRWWEEVG